jgi:hypothetical protein
MTRTSSTILALLLILIMLSVTACDNWRTGKDNPRPEDVYFRGSEGVRMQFVPGSPPPRMFYYLGGSQEENQFEVSVELKNEGASDAIGALYISGYSPDLVRFEDVELRPRSWTECSFDYGYHGSGDIFGGQLFFDCPGVSGGIADLENWRVNLDDLGSLLDVDWLNGVDVDVVEGRWSFRVGMDTFGSIELFNHGRMLAIILSSRDLKAFYGFPFNEGPGVLRGDNHYYPGGDLGYQNFIGHVGHNWPPGLDQTDVTFLITSCYGYSTYAAPTICIDPAPYDQSRKVCTPRKVTWSGGQGAPVAITELRQESTPRKVYLTFTVRNIGQGRVFNIGYLQRCSPYYPGRMDGRHMDVVYIGDIRIGTQPLRCQPSREVRLNNGVGTFTCEYDIEYATVKSAYETPVVVELWYGYQQTMQTRMNIKRAV